jgi:predicted TIM-barrel fold metal-dependent hydrolase
MTYRQIWEAVMSTVLERKPNSPLKPDYPVYDADHHYYETPEAFLRHLPKKYHSAFQYVTLANGRTKLAIDGVISEYIPNPTFNVVAGPGKHEAYYRANNPKGLTMREMSGEPVRSIPAFHSGPAHLKMMDELGVHAAIVFPTLASIIEVRLGHKVELTMALMHALNRWVADEYGFGNGRQFPVGAISLAEPDGAVKELEFLLEAGCKQVLIRPAPVPTATGTRSPGDPVLDPFWALCAQEKVLINNHTSDSGYNRTYREWSGSGAAEWTPFERGALKDMMDDMGRAASDSISTLICHGVFDRHPGLRLLVTESGSAWIAPLLQRFERTFHKLPWEFGRNPVKTFHEHVYVMPFYEDSVSELAKHMPLDHICFGSDWPHPEGLAEPLEFFGDIRDLSAADQKKVMSTNLKTLLEAHH